MGLVGHISLLVMIHYFGSGLIKESYKCVRSTGKDFSFCPVSQAHFSILLLRFWISIERMRPSFLSGPIDCNRPYFSLGEFRLGKPMTTMNDDDELAHESTTALPIRRDVVGCAWKRRIYHGM